MALPALKFELENPVEERVARLDVNVEHIQSDVSEMKIDVRRLNDKIDGLKESVAALSLTMEKSFAELKIGRAFDRVWWLLMSGALLGLMARALHWI
jgi:hypothetical protein